MHSGIEFSVVEEIINPKIVVVKRKRRESTDDDGMTVIQTTVKAMKIKKVVVRKSTARLGSIGVNGDIHLAVTVIVAATVTPIVIENESIGNTRRNDEKKTETAMATITDSAPSFPQRKKTKKCYAPGDKVKGSYVATRP